VNPGFIRSCLIPYFRSCLIESTIVIALSVEERLKLRAWFGTLKEIELVALASTAFHFLERFSFAMER
jgi:hypothetical protein